MQETTKKPAIRFAGYNDAWEQRKVSELAVFEKGSGYSKGDLKDVGTPIILYGRLYTKYQFEIGEVDTFADIKTGSVFSKGDEVIVPASGETAEDIARAAAIVKPGILLGGDLNVLHPFAFMNPSFVALSISNGQPQKELSKKAQGKSVVHVHNSDIQEVTISYPSRDEQDKIVSFFSRLDHLITLHQRKYSMLMNIKKSMLEKMFPRNGAKVPEIRFAGFTDAWEQRKLGEIAEIVGGGTPSTSIPEYWDGDIHWYAPAEMEGKRYADNSVRKITELGLKNSSAKVLPANKTVLFTSRAGIGKTAILRHPAATNQGFQSLVLYDECNPYFIYSRSDEIKQKAEGVASGSTFLEISGKMLFNIEIALPCKDEQDAIAAFFERLDDLITLHQRELERLQNIKKSCLEKMFV